MQRPLTDAVSAVLSGTGLGLLLWLGISVALLPPGAGMAALRAPQMWSLILALVLLSVAGAIAVSASRPPRGVRGLLRAPTRWHARRNALALSAVVLALSTGTLLSWAPSGASRALALGLAGMLLSVTSLGAVAANAMVRPTAAASRTPPHPLVVPVELLSAMLTGLALMFALLSGLLAVGQGGGRMLVILLVLGVLVAGTSALHWRGATSAGSGRPSAGARSRRHGLAASAMVVAVPALAWAMAGAGMGGPTLWLWVVALASFAGAVLERLAFLTLGHGQASPA